MRVVFVASFLGKLSTHRAQMELINQLNTQCDEFLLVGEFSQSNAEWLTKRNINLVNTKLRQKIDQDFINLLKDIKSNLNPDIVHVINSRLLRSVNIAFKKHPTKVVAYFGSMSLYWHDPSSYLTFLSPRVDKIICNSDHVYQHVRKQLLWRKNKAVRIYKGYDTSWYDTIIPFDYTTLNIPNNAVIVTLAASHSKNKRIKDFISSALYLEVNQPIHYVIFGHGTENKDLQELRKNSPLRDAIHLLGLRKDAVELISGADIYVQTSLKEGFGRAVSEAMCVGKPVIMTNSGGGTELIDENSGIIVPRKNPKALGLAISKLANDKEERLKMGAKAKKRIAENFHIDKTVEEVLNLYKQLVEE